MLEPIGVLPINLFMYDTSGELCCSCWCGACRRCCCGVVCGLGVVAVVGLDVDRGYGLGFVVGAYTYL